MRNEIEGRPLLGVVCALIIGLSAPLHPVNLLFLPFAFLMWRSMAFRIGMSAALLAGVLLAPTPAPTLKERIEFDKVVRVGSVPRLYESGIAFEAKVGDVNAWVRVPSHSRVSYGDWVRVSGVMRPLGASDRYLTLQGISAQAYAEQCVLVRSGPWLMQMANGWRWSFVDFAYSTLPRKFAAVASALCFNTDKLLDGDFHNDLQVTGTIHIVSVSGLHIVVLSLALLFGLSKLPIPRGAQLSIAALVLGFYALATGLSPPTVRSVLMVGIGFAAYCVRREPDWLSSLACSAILFLLWQPRAVYDIGFQLSFLTVASFCLYLRPDRVVQNSPQVTLVAQVREVAVASVVASIATAPLVIYYFNQVSLISVIANVMIALPVQAIIIGSFLAHLVSFGAPLVSGVAMEWLVKQWIGYLYGMLDFMAKPEWAAVAVPEFNAYWLVPFYGVALMMWRPYVRRA